MTSKSKKLRFTVFITIILTIVAFFLIFNNRHSTINLEESEFHIKDTASISKIFMSNKKDSTLLMERETGDRWRLNGKYYVRKDIIQTILKTFYKIKIRKPVQNAAVDNTIKLLATSAVKVEVYQNTYKVNLFNKIKLFPYEKLTKTVYVGFDTQDNMGTIMLLEGAERPYVTHIPAFRGALSSRFVVNASQYRDLNLFARKINEIDKIVVDLPQNNSESYRLINNNDKTISLLNQEGKNIPYVDTIKVLRYLNYFQKIDLDELFIDGRTIRDSLLNEAQPTHIVKLFLMNGKQETARIYLKKNIRLPYFEEKLNLLSDKEKFELMKMENEPEWNPDVVYVVYNNDKDVGLGPRWVLEKIMRTKTYFTNELPEEE